MHQNYFDRVATIKVQLSRRTILHDLTILVLPPSHRSAQVYLVQAIATMEINPFFT
jgi:hypothetical protein